MHSRISQMTHDPGSKLQTPVPCPDASQVKPPRNGKRRMSMASINPQTGTSISTPWLPRRLRRHASFSLQLWHWASSQKYPHRPHWPRRLRGIRRLVKDLQLLKAVVALLSIFSTQNCLFYDRGFRRPGRQLKEVVILIYRSALARQDSLHLLSDGDHLADIRGPRVQ